MELDRNQPSVGGLRETLAPWYDHAASWVVLLCVALTVFSAVSAYVMPGSYEQLVSLLTRIAVTVAAMFVLSAALERTGVVERAGLLLSRYASGSPLMGMFTLTAGAATVSAFMNNTPVVVILTPVASR